MSLTKLGWQPPGEDWEPGEPLFDRHTHGNSQYFYNFRDDPKYENCACIDAASWPEARPSYRLADDYDELDRFIEEWHDEHQEIA